MLKITGSILCILGCTGYGIAKISLWEQAAAELQEWIVLFQKMKSQIDYQKEVLEDICMDMEQQIYGLGGRYVASIGKMAVQQRSKSLQEIWREQLKDWKKQSKLPARIQNKILDFSSYMGEKDRELQLNFLASYIHELEKEKKELEKQMADRKKPVLAVSIVSGMVLSILFV